MAAAYLVHMVVTGPRTGSVQNPRQEKPGAREPEAIWQQIVTAFE